MDSLKFPREHNLVPRVLFPPKPGKSALGTRLMGAIATSSLRLDWPVPLDIQIEI